MLKKLYEWVVKKRDKNSHQLRKWRVGLIIGVADFFIVFYILAKII